MQWAEAPALIRAWQAQDRIEALRQDCFTWWQTYKMHLAADTQAAVQAVCG
jgi:hypothetical protein